MTKPTPQAPQEDDDQDVLDITVDEDDSWL
jgi:hypothetical protein